MIEHLCCFYWHQVLGPFCLFLYHRIVESSRQESAEIETGERDQQMKLETGIELGSGHKCTGTICQRIDHRTVSADIGNKFKYKVKKWRGKPLRMMQDQYGFLIYSRAIIYLINSPYLIHPAPVYYLFTACIIL